MFTSLKLMLFKFGFLKSNFWNKTTGRVTGRIGQSNAYAEVGVAKNKANYEYNDSLMSYSYLARSIAEKLGLLLVFEFFFRKHFNVKKFLKA